MNHSEHNDFSVQKPSETSSGAYTSPPPIGYPTRDVVIGDPPAAAVETKSKDGQEASTCCGCKCANIAACLNCFAALFNSMEASSKVRFPIPNLIRNREFLEAFGISLP